MITGDCRLRFAGSGRNAIFASKEYHLTAIRIVFSHHGDYSFPLMEIISVTRGDHPSDPWRLSPSTKGMLPLRPACPHCRCKGTTYQWRLLCYFVRFGTLLCSSAEKKLFSWFAEVFHDQLHLTAGLWGVVIQSGISITTTRVQSYEKQNINTPYVEGTRRGYGLGYFQ